MPESLLHSYGRPNIMRTFLSKINLKDFLKVTLFEFFFFLIYLNIMERALIFEYLNNSMIYTLVIYLMF